MSNTILHVTDSSFEQDVLKAEKPVLLDFWAEWCRPCRTVAPILDELANQYKDQLIVAKLNIDNDQETPKKYGVRGIPTLMIFNNGDVVDSRVGAATKSAMETFIEKNIKPATD